MTTYLRIDPRDPLVARDGRPFGANSGNRMRSTGWPTPSVVAGSFRTALGKRLGVDFHDAAVLKALKDIEVAGVLPVAVAEREDDPGELLLPAPYDCVVYPNKKAYAALPRPLGRGEGCDWPDGLELLPVMLDETAPDKKAATGPAFWPLELYAKWLTGNYVSLTDERFVAAAEPDLRDHVEIEDVSGTARDARLFTTAGIAIAALERTNSGDRKGFDRKRRTRLTARVENLPADWAGLDTLHPLGGERRLVHWKPADDGSLWRCPTTVSDKLKGGGGVRMTLVTPAIFSGGWKPAWVGGSPPCGGPALTLVGVCIHRWRAVSGWSYEKPIGPKAIRRMVPAGSTYFFRTDDKREDLVSGWLRSVSDDAQDRRDGFGLAAWGVWNPERSTK